MSRIVSQTINLTKFPESVAKYITNINENAGITVHAINGVNENYIQLNTEGLELFQDAKSVAKFGDSVRIGEENSFHVEINNNELGFWSGINRPDTQFNKIAYLNGNQLYITQSVVLNRMDVGSPLEEVAPDVFTGGQWSWKIHSNEEGTNNLYLKWIG